MIPLRLYAYAAAGLALASGVLWYGHSQKAKGNAAGRAAVTAKWEADTKARNTADAAIRAQNAAKEATARERNDAIVTDYTTQLAAAVGSRDSYFRLLQRARQVRPESTCQIAGTDSPSATGTDQSPDGAGDPAERIDQAIAAVIAEHRANAEQLNSLIRVVQPQL